MLTNEEREEIINVLVVMTGKIEKYYENMDDQRLLEHYDKLTKQEVTK